MFKPVEDILSNWVKHNLVGIGILPAKGTFPPGSGEHLLVKFKEVNKIEAFVVLAPGRLGCYINFTSSNGIFGFYEIVLGVDNDFGVESGAFLKALKLFIQV